MAIQQHTTSPNANNVVRIALPSKDDFRMDSLVFMDNCGLNVSLEHERKYTANVSNLEKVEVLFQRTGVITQIVEEGTAEFGIVGLDRYLESRKEGGSNSAILIKDLPFSKCELSFAVPKSWLDVDSMYDVWDLSIRFRQERSLLRIATEYPRLVQYHLQRNGIRYFTLVPWPGGVESSPTAGHADMIATIRGQGTTLTANGLKTISSGTILTSQACLITNPDTFKKHPQKLALAKPVLKHMDAFLARDQESYKTLFGIVSDE